MADYAGLMTSAQWPSIEQLNARICVSGKRFVAQDEGLLSDALHYEARIAQGRIATRLDNWHDLFNAMAWGRYPPLKLALNAAQCRHIALLGPSFRNRAQQALTQFDETGVIVRVSDPALLAAWDRHDWQALFVDGATQWRSGAVSVDIFGHALLEQGLVPERQLVGKCLVVLGDDTLDPINHVAAAIHRGEVLCDPQELRPLPLLGIPGWGAAQSGDFYRQHDYFRPLREGRRYPPPLRAQP